jgi:flagellar biogenesis protein FliO
MKESTLSNKIGDWSILIGKFFMAIGCVGLLFWVVTKLWWRTLFGSSSVVDCIGVSAGLAVVGGIAFIIFAFIFFVPLTKI